MVRRAAAPLGALEDQLFTRRQIVDRAREEGKNPAWIDELQRVSVSAENAYASRRQRMRADVIDLLRGRA